MGQLFDPVAWSTAYQLMVGSFASGFEGVIICQVHSVVRLNNYSEAFTVQFADLFQIDSSVDFSLKRQKRCAVTSQMSASWRLSTG